MVGEKAVSATVFPHLLSVYIYILSTPQVQCYPLLWQLHPNFRNLMELSVIKITLAESGPNMGLSIFLH